MRLAILLNASCPRRLQIALAERLRSLGHRVTLQIAASSPPLPAGLGLLEMFEETLYGRKRPYGARLSEGELRSAIGEDTGETVDLTIDLASGGLSPARAGRKCVLQIEGIDPEAGIAGALLDCRPPCVDLILVEPGGETRMVQSGIPAVPDANVFIRGFEAVAARLITLTELAVARIERADPGDRLREPLATSRPSLLKAIAFAPASIAEKVAHRLRRMSRQVDRWVVGWREFRDDAVIDTLTWPEGGYQWLPDDGLRYYADPFVFEREGQRYLFVEEYVYATGRGHLSVARWTGGGWSTPRAILERPYHLSWPRVFERDGEIWMLPETSAARTLELYRAVDFPNAWELANVLVDDISLADATTIERDDGHWMLASIVDQEGASPWDGVAILRAKNPLRAWRLTGQGAVLIDVRAARPAGEIVRRGDHWLRPVQDCSLGYGSALGIARIDMLGEGQLSQTVLATLPPRAEWNAIGVHTLNADAGIEVIDINRGFDVRRRPPSSPR